jgi:hypothetical protein
LGFNRKGNKMREIVRKAKVERVGLFGGGHNWRVRECKTIWGWSDAAGKAFDSRRAAEDWAIENGYHLID